MINFCYSCNNIDYSKKKKNVKYHTNQSDKCGVFAMASENAKSKYVRECIVTSLIELMKKQDYYSISITDITAKAGVSRMAYYRNYKSKDDILNTYMDEVGQAIHNEVAESRGNNDYYRYFLALFEQLGKYSDIGMVAYRANLGDLIRKNINKNVLLSFPPEDDSAEAKYKRLLIAGAFYNVFSEWLAGGKRESCDEMARICSSMIK